MGKSSEKTLGSERDSRSVAAKCMCFRTVPGVRGVVLPALEAANPVECPRIRANVTHLPCSTGGSTRRSVLPSGAQRCWGAMIEVIDRVESVQPVSGAQCRSVVQNNGSAVSTDDRVRGVGTCQGL